MPAMASPITNAASSLAANSRKVSAARNVNASHSAANDAAMAMATEAPNSHGSYRIGGDIFIAAMPV